jgi:hypothetical protein
MVDQVDYTKDNRNALSIFQGTSTAGCYCFGKKGACDIL